MLASATAAVHCVDTVASVFLLALDIELLVVVVIVAERYVFGRATYRYVVCKSGRVDISAVQSEWCIPCDVDESLLVEVFYSLRLRTAPGLSIPT